MGRGRSMRLVLRREVGRFRKVKFCVTGFIIDKVYYGVFVLF